LTLISASIDNFHEAFMTEFLDDAFPKDQITVSINHHPINPPYTQTF